MKIKYRTIPILLVILFGSAYTPGVTANSARTDCSEAEHARLNIVPIPQHRDWWCWAATTEMIAEYEEYFHIYGVYDPNSPETEQVALLENVFSDSGQCNYYVPTCLQCPDPAENISEVCQDCNCNCQGPSYGATIEEIECIWDKTLGFGYEREYTYLPWNELKQALACQGSPVQAIRAANGGGFHAVVIVGFGEISASGLATLVEFWDPWPGDCVNNGGTCSSSGSGGEYKIVPYAVDEHNAYGRNYWWRWSDMIHDFNYVGN